MLPSVSNVFRSSAVIPTNMAMSGPLRGYGCIKALGDRWAHSVAPALGLRTAGGEKGCQPIQRR